MENKRKGDVIAAFDLTDMLEVERDDIFFRPTNLPFAQITPPFGRCVTEYADFQYQY